MFGSWTEGVPDPKGSLRCCLTEVEAEVCLQITLEPDCTRVVLANLVLLELHPPALLWPLIELSLSLKIGEKHTVAPDVSSSVGNHLLLSCVDLFSTTVNMVSDGMLLMQKDLTLGIITLNRFLGILLVFQKRDSSHSLESWKFLEAQSALTFNLPGKHDLFRHCKFPNLFGNGYHLLVPSIEYFRKC